MKKEGIQLKEKKALREAIVRGSFFLLMICVETFAELIVIVGGATIGFEMAMNTEELLTLGDFIGFIFLAIFLKFIASECKKKFEGKKTIMI